MSTTPTTLKESHAKARTLSWPWLRPPLEWFFCYPFLFFQTIGLLLIALAVVWDPLNLNRIGLSSLFWHESLWVQFTAGLGIATVLGEICLAGYLLDAGRTWMRRRVYRVNVEQPRRTSWWYFFGTLTYPTLVLVAALPAAFSPATRWALPAGLFSGTLVIAAMAWLGRSISPENSGLFDWLLNLPKLRRSLPDDLQHLLAERRFILRLSADERRKLSSHFHLHSFQVFVSLILMLMYGLLYMAAAYYSAEFVSPALVICVLMALITTVYGFIVFHFPMRHFGVSFLLVAAYLVINSFLGPQHRFDGLNYDNPTRLSELESSGRSESGLLNNRKVLDAWRKQFPADRRPVLVVIAVKGGGARSAAWTTAVLTGLERHIPELPYRTRLISGVSGGMLGATYYVTTLNPPGSPRSHAIPRDLAANAGQPEDDLLKIVDIISQDSLSPVVRHLALPLPGDRGEALEKAWEKNTSGALTKPFAQLRDGERQGWRPSLVFSPMLVEDGRRLLISNLDLHFLVRNTGSLLTDPKSVPGEYSTSGFQFFELFPDAIETRLSTIVRMNASFPYITPDAELATEPPRRVVDAAFYDRYGVNLAALWIHHSRNWILEHAAGVVLIQIRDRPRDIQEPPRWRRWRRAISQFTTPLEGAIRARNATMSFRNDELLSLLDGEFNRGEDRDFFTTVVFEYPGRAPLSWYLPPEDLQHIKDAVKPDNEAFNSSLRALKRWWQPREAM